MTSKTHFLDKKKEADTLIKRFTLIAAGTGFIPIPLVDAVAMSGVQYTMVRKLAYLYEVPFKGHRVKAIGAAFMGSVGTISGFKFIPKIGTVIGGISSSTIGAASTYAIGQVFMQHFDQGGTLLNFDPLASRIHFEQELEKGKTIVAKLKEDATLSTEKGQRKVIQQLKADSDEYLAILANLQVTLEEYKNQLAEPTLVASPVVPSVIIEKDREFLEEVEEIEVAVPVIEKATNSSIIEKDREFLEETLVILPIVEKLSWWKRLKQWVKQKTYTIKKLAKKQEKES